MQKLALSINGTTISGPAGVPTGGALSIVLLIRLLIEVAILVGIVFCIFILILSGFQWLSSAGDKQTLATARLRITYAIVGLAVIIISLLVVQVFSQFFNINLLNLPTS